MTHCPMNLPAPRYYIDAHGVFHLKEDDDYCAAAVSRLVYDIATSAAVEEFGDLEWGGDDGVFSVGAGDDRVCVFIGGLSTQARAYAYFLAMLEYARRKRAAKAAAA